MHKIDSIIKQQQYLGILPLLNFIKRRLRLFDLKQNGITIVTRT